MLSPSALTIAPYALLSIASLLTALLFLIAVSVHARRRYMLVGSGVFLLIAVWFAGIAVSAGPAPLVKRGDLADPLRWLALVTSLVWCVWLVLYARSMIKIER